MNETNEKENKSNESAQQGAETNKKIEELINRKVEELLQTPVVKVIYLTKEEVLRDWKEKEEELKKSRKIPGKNDEETVEIIYEHLVSDYSKGIKNYEKYLHYKFESIEHANKERFANFMDRYLVPGLGIMRRQKIEIYSAPNVGKTFVSLELAHKIAVGGWVFNTPEYAVPRPFKVLYVDNENYDTLTDRLNRMIMYNQELAYKNIKLIRNGGVLTEDETKKEYLPVDRFGKMDKKTDSLADAIIAIARATDFIPDLIVVDPLADVMYGDENKTQDMETFKKDMDRLIKYLGATIIINHHSRKDSTGDLYGSRGSTVLPGALDMAIELRAKEQEDNEEEEFEPPLETEEKEDDDKTRKSILSFHMTKNRSGAKLRPFYLGIFDTPIEELSFKPPVDNAEIEKGLLVAKIYRDKKSEDNDRQKQGRLPTRPALNMAEIVNLMYKKGLDPAKISEIQEEEYQEKIYNTFKKVESYRKDMDPVKIARGRLNYLVKEYLNSKPINPFI